MRLMKVDGKEKTVKRSKKSVVLWVLGTLSVVSFAIILTIFFLVNKIEIPTILGMRG